MKIYLVQHGKAYRKDVDPQRPLTEEGQAQTKRIAEMAAKLGLDVSEIRHSGKTRAEETAVIFGRALSLMGNVKAVSGMNPTDDVEPVAEALAQEKEPVMLVGHMPFMARLAGLLVKNNPNESPVTFRNSGVVCVERQPDGWQLNWVLAPR
jgi:phosphohistidine phosphatase